MLPIVEPSSIKLGRATAAGASLRALLASASFAKMRAVIQRVTSASVEVDGQIVGKISKGLMVLVGKGRNDTTDDVDWLSKKVLACRLFDRDGKWWSESVNSLNLEVLLVSQFTLHANTRKPKPDFHRSMGPGAAQSMFDAFVTAVRTAHPGGPEKVQTGTFGAMMNVSLVNDGPVTVSMDSKNRQDKAAEDEAGEGTGATPTPTATPGGSTEQ